MRSFRQIGWLRAGLAIALTVMVSTTAWAQRTSGNISGDGAPGDKVLVRNEGTGFKRETVADDEGKYTVRALPTGNYHVVVTRGDATVANLMVAVRPGTTTRVPTLAGPADAAAADAAAPPGN